MKQIVLIFVKKEWQFNGAVAFIFDQTLPNFIYLNDELWNIDVYSRLDD